MLKIIKGIFGDSFLKNTGFIFTRWVMGNKEKA
jgi:hypothetical protein